MRRRAIAVAAASPALLALAVPARGDAPAPARVQVVAVEFTLSLSRLSIRSGPAIVELANFGEDPHDLYLRRQAKGAPTLTVTKVLPGEIRRIRARLAPGRFLLWCSIGDHREHVMTATLVVRRR